MVALSGSGWRLAPSLVAFVEEADRCYPKRDRTSDGSIGDLAHQARVSDHNPDDGWVHAVDLDEDLAPGLDLKAFAEKLRRRRDPRVKYVIYEGRFFSSYATSSRAAWAWAPYTGVNAHLHHLHLSILHTDAARNDLSQWGFAPLAPKPPTTPLEDEMHVYLRAETPEEDRILCDPALGLYLNGNASQIGTGTGTNVVSVRGAGWDRLVKKLGDRLVRL
jgi:hypothetical protein